MKITFNPTTKTQETDKKSRFIQNASNNYVYLYGVEAGWLIKATFTRRDDVQIGNIPGVMDVDPEGTDCYVIKVPTQAVELDKQLSVSLNIYEPSGAEYIAHSTVDTAAYVYPNKGVIVPDDLETVIADQINIAIGNLELTKHEASALVGIVGETIDKNTEVFTKLKTLEEIAAEINKIISGIYTAKKAERDADGNIITTTYETKADANTAKARITENETNISNLQENKEDKVNRKTDFAENSDQYYVTQKGIKTELDKKVNKTTTIMDLNLEDNITRTEVAAALGTATQILSGLMSATDKTRLDALHALLGTTADADAVVNTINEVLAIFQNYPEGADLVTVLVDKVDKVEGKQLSTNDLTDILKNHYDTAYTHSQVEDGTNPHKTTFDNLQGKPNTIATFGITDAFTKSEVQTMINDLKAVYGWEMDDLTPTALEDTDTLALSAVSGYDQLLFVCRNTSTDEIDTQKVPIVELTNGTDIEFFGNSAIVANVDTTNITFSDVGAAETLKIYGVKMDKSQFNEIRNIEEQSITYRTDGKVSQVVGDNVTTTPTYDTEGNLIKITEVYALDNKTYETTFTRDALGRIINTNKQEVI